MSSLDVTREYGENACPEEEAVVAAEAIRDGLREDGDVRGYAV